MIDFLPKANKIVLEGRIAHTWLMDSDGTMFVVHEVIVNCFEIELRFRVFGHHSGFVLQNLQTRILFLHSCDFHVYKALNNISNRIRNVGLQITFIADLESFLFALVKCL